MAPIITSTPPENGAIIHVYVFSGGPNKRALVALEICGVIGDFLVSRVVLSWPENRAT